MLVGRCWWMGGGGWVGVSVVETEKGWVSS